MSTPIEQRAAAAAEAEASTGSKLAERAAEVERAREDGPGILRTLDRYRHDIEEALPSTFVGGIQRFQQVVWTAMRQNPNLAACTPVSIISGVIAAAQLGLTPNLMGQAWLIPYENRKAGTFEATFQIGWKGLVTIGARSEMLFHGDTVKAADELDYEHGLTPKLRHVKALGPGVKRGESYAWWASVRFHDNRLDDFAVIDKEHVEKRRLASKSPNSPAWVNWYDEMAIGKAIRELCRTLELPVELARAVDLDDRVLTIDDVRREVIEATITNQERPNDDR